MSETTDVIDSLLEVGENSRLARLRGEHPEVRARTQSCYLALFNPPTSSGLSLHERLAPALRVAELHEIESLAAHYRGRIRNETPDAEASGRVIAMLRHAELVTRYPAKAVQRDLVKLAALGLAPPDIVTLSQIIAFVAYQARVLVAFGYLGDNP